MNTPIAVLGFGRSGTTWVSDILSKCLGGLILFEPMFPSALPDAEKYCYSDGEGQASATKLNQHLQDVLSGRNHARWLLRNHVNHPVDEVDGLFLESIWDECRIIGFKEIRANFMLARVTQEWGFNTLFVLRHPIAVISSLQGRPGFWRGDFGGLNNHYNMFTERVLKNIRYRAHFSDIDLRELSALKHVEEKEAVLWAATHKIVLEDLKNFQIPTLFYEDLFAHPFRVTRQLFTALGIDSLNLHPAYIFTPSMATMRTTHDLYYSNNPLSIRGPSMFWEDKLNNEEIRRIVRIIEMFGVNLYDGNNYPKTNAVADLNIVGRR